MLKATEPAFTAVLTTKAEAWLVRVASTHMSCSRHTHHTMAQRCGYRVGMWMMLMVLELLVVVWGIP